MNGSNISKVFYATSYHPIQAGSIDGTDIFPHDNAVRRALLCSTAGIYDPFGDPKATGDPYCTVFVGRLSHFTTESTLRSAMSKYGRVKSLRLVRHIVTGASRGYAFVEYETEREMRRAYEAAHHSIIDDHEIIVDFNRQQLMPGWIPRRLGGGLGGKKESGQLRFGGRERPFRAPLRPIPHEELKKLGIPQPPEGKYMSRNQVLSPPRRKRSLSDREERFQERCSLEREECNDRNTRMGSEEGYHRKRSADREKQRNLEIEERHYHRDGSEDGKDHSESKIRSDKKRLRDKEERYGGDKAEPSHKTSSDDREGHSWKRYKHRHSHRHRRSSSMDHHSSG